MAVNDILKMMLVFVHFFASAVAVATILRTDFLILSYYTSTLTRKAVDRIHSAKTVVSASLTVLWISGLAICLQGYLNDPAYLLNQKLWLKVMVVVALTLNGWFLHRFAFGSIQRGARLCDAMPHQRAVLVLMATISSSSWIFACFLGIARALNNKHNFAGLVSLYLLLLGVSLVGALVLTHLLTRMAGSGSRDAQRWQARVKAFKHRLDAGQESELQV